MSKLSSSLTEVNELVFQANRYSMNWLESNIGAFARDRFEYRESMRIELDGKLREFTTQLLERKIVEDSYPTYYNYKVPASWFQHLKLDKAPKWFTNRYPVKFQEKRVKRTVTITRKATYPMADIVVPKNMGHVVIRDIISPTSFYEEQS